MRARERESGRLQVIVLRAGPTGRLVTLCARGAARAGVDVVRCVAGGTLGWGVLVPVAHVAGCAGRLHMLAGQREPGLGVIKPHTCPAAGFVAAGAIAAQLAFVRFFFLVTIDACGRHLTMFAARHVASRARYRGVRSLQGKVGLRVREGSGLELDDVGLAALVVGVAGAAMSGLRPGQPTVESLALCNVGSDGLMTSAAEGRLPRTIRAIVAARALLLVLRVTCDDRSGHQQRLEARRTGVQRRHRESQDREQESAGAAPAGHACDSCRSVDVYRDHMDGPGDDEHEEERHVQGVPQREERLESAKLEHAPRRADAIVDVAIRRQSQRFAARVVTTVRSRRYGFTDCTSQPASCHDCPRSAQQWPQQQRGRRKSPFDDGLFFVDTPRQRGQERH